MRLCEELGTANKIKGDELLNAQQTLSEMKIKEVKTSEKLEQTMKRLSKLSARNVTKRKARRDQKLEELIKSLNDNEKHLAHLAEN